MKIYIVKTVTLSGRLESQAGFYNEYDAIKVAKIMNKLDNCVAEVYATDADMSSYTLVWSKNNA